MGLSLRAKLTVLHFLLHIKHNINHFLPILHVTDQTRAVAVIMGDYFARKTFFVAVAIVAVVFRS